MASSCSLKQRMTMVQLDKPCFWKCTRLENPAFKNLSRALQNLLLPPPREWRLPFSAPFTKSHLPQFQLKKPLPKQQTPNPTTTNTKNSTEQVIKLPVIYRHCSQLFTDHLSENSQFWKPVVTEEKQNKVRCCNVLLAKLKTIPDIKSSSKAYNNPTSRANPHYPTVTLYGGNWLVSDDALIIKSRVPNSQCKLIWDCNQVNRSLVSFC